MYIKSVIIFVLVVFPCATSFAVPPRPQTSSTLAIEGVKQHPAMSMTPADVERGRHNYKTHEWAKQIGDDITSAANIWLNRDANWIRQHMPGKAACFAYGFAGCPECGGKTGIWAAANCSFDNPGTVVCFGGHRLPNKKYPDSGKGYTGSDGRIHYFAGTYNAWAIEKFIYGAYDLAYAYSLTGDMRYATRCAEIMDSVADIYPTCTIGSWDYPETRPGQNSGRFNRPQYQVGRVLIPLSDTYDQIFHVAAMDEPSVRAGLTRRENIEKNMLQDGAWYCYEKSFGFSGLTNGSADYIKGAMVVGLVLGIPEYVTWAVDGPYGIRSMLANNIGRDGTYYETATGYSYYTRSIYRGYAEYLRNYRGSAYPDGVDLYRDDRFKDFMELLNLKTQLGGAMASYGDAAPNSKPWEVKDDPPFEKYDFECLEYLRIRATDPQDKKNYNILSHWLSEGRPEKYYKGSASERWFLFNAQPLPPKREGGVFDISSPVLRSHILGQKGLAMLRTGRKPGESQGVMLRFGPSLNHGNFDDLNFTYHAFGHDVTYDLGYALASAHVFSGWSKQTASHQLVVVDEKSQGGDGAPSGGSLLAFMSGDYTQAMEASAPGSYRSQGVREYARTMFLVDDMQSTQSTINGVIDSTTPYLVDIFRVDGGTKHDSFSHAPGKEITLGGVNRGTVTSGSLAGMDTAWGDKILVDGDIAGQPNKPYWIAPPENGYGFLVEPQLLEPAEPVWWADWKLPENDDHVRLWFPFNESETVKTAWGPGILKTLPDAQYVVRSRKPVNGKSVFVTVWEPYEKESTIAGVEEIIADEDQGSSWPAVAVKVTHKDGSIDLLYSAADDKRRTYGDTTIAGRLGRITSKKDRLVIAETLGLSYLVPEADRDSVSLNPTVSGSIINVDVDNGIVETNAKIPDISFWNQTVITFSNPSYSRSTAYQIKAVEQLTTGSRILLTEDCVLGRGVVDDVDETSSVIQSLISHEYAKPVNRKGDSEFFKGKRLVSGSGHVARVRSIPVGQPMQIYVDSIDGFSKNDSFRYEDIGSGDTFEILSYTGAR